MFAVVFYQGITAMDVAERPIPRDHVCIKPDLVLINGIENSIYLGILWVEPLRILGGVATGVVKSVGVDVDQSLVGKKILTFPFSMSYGGIGTDVDGVMASRAVIPRDSIVYLPQAGAEEKHLLLPYVSIVSQVMEMAEGKRVLIIGSGLLGIISSYLLRDKAFEVAMYRDSFSYSIRGDFKEIRELKDTWDLVVVSSLRGWVRSYVYKLIGEKGKAVLPKISKRWPPFVVGKSNVVEVYPNPQAADYALLNKMPSKLISEILGKSDDIISSIPSTKPGVLVNFPDPQ